MPRLLHELRYRTTFNHTDDNADMDNWITLGVYEELGCTDIVKPNGPDQSASSVLVVTVNPLAKFNCTNEQIKRALHDIYSQQTCSCETVPHCGCRVVTISHIAAFPDDLFVIYYHSKMLI